MKNMSVEDRKEALFTALTKYPQVTEITAEYNGSGDEGFLDSVDFFNEKGEGLSLGEELQGGIGNRTGVGMLTSTARARRDLQFGYLGSALLISTELPILPKHTEIGVEKIGQSLWRITSAPWNGATISEGELDFDLE